MSFWEVAQRAGMWAMGGANRARARGARVQVCAFVLAIAPAPSVLMVKSRYGDWMPPQEGVRTDERFEDAFWRCLDEELGIEVKKEVRSRQFTLRGAQRLGTLDLPRDRWGERPVADDVEDGPLSHVQLKRKAYWGLYALVAAQEQLAPRPNTREVEDARWMSLAEAEQAIDDTVRPEKATLLKDGLRHSERALLGSRRREVLSQG